MEQSQVLPKHIGFVVDGNRRWAREKGLATLAGHNKGIEKVELIIKSAAKAKIPFISFYLFSTKNWSRSKEEVSYLMRLLKTKIKTLSKTAKDHNLKCIFMSTPNGRLEQSIKDQFAAIEQDTKDCSSGTICFCIDYGGQQEIADAARQITLENGDFTPDNITRHLYHPEVPPCDLIVRTSGEERLSDFMLWRAAYSELLFLKKFWPDITSDDFTYILTEYQKRSRRFGK